MKRYSILIVLLLVFLCSIILTGCGGTAKETSTSSSNPTNSQGVAAKEETISELFAKGQNVKGISYEYEMSVKGNLTLSGKVWLQENKMKIEATTNGQRMINIINENSIINYYPDQKTAYQLTLDKAQQIKTPLEYLKEANSQTDKYKSVETIVYNGVKCRVVSLVGPNGQELTKMWLSEDYGIPVKIEAVDLDGNRSVLEYKNLKVGPLPEDTFKLPADIQVTDMSKLTNQIPQLPKTN